MLKYTLAVILIFLATAFAWIILGATLVGRTELADNRLRTTVASIWGAPQRATPPESSFCWLEPQPESADGPASKEKCSSLSLASSAIQVRLQSDPRQKGLLWYRTYLIDFEGAYTFEEPPLEGEARFGLKLPSKSAVYDRLALELNGAPVRVTSREDTADARVEVKQGQPLELRVRYSSQGLNDWRYNFGSGANQVASFLLTVDTDFKDIDFPDGTLAPTRKLPTDQGWKLTWDYAGLVTTADLSVVVPEILQPGPVASRVVFFAPVSLFFFFFLLLLITAVQQIRIHPMNYFLLACAFFAFHLLLAYLVDHISLPLAMLISSVVSVLLVVTYLRAMAGRKLAMQAGMIQFLYLVLFSYAFLLDGYTGLTITIGSILTLAAVMRMTATIRWDEQLASEPATRNDRGRILD